MTNQTTRVLELLKRFNNGQKVCIESLKYETLWYGKSEKTIRRDLDVIKEVFPESFELVRGGEKGCYKAITKEAFNNFTTPDMLSLMVQTFNIVQSHNMLDSLNIDEDDKRIIAQKIEKSKACYSFVTKPYESQKSDELLLKEIEKAINGKRYTTLYYRVSNELKRYEVKPYKILFINENFYLACENRNEAFLFTLFRLSNIEKIELQSQTFYLNLDIERFIKQIQTTFSSYTPDFRKHLIEVKVEIDKGKSKFFKAKNFLPSQKIEEEKYNGNLIVSFSVTQELEVEELIKSWIPHIRVISPLSLKEKIESELKAYLSIKTSDEIQSKAKK